jgi:hypothetical protein
MRFHLFVLIGSMLVTACSSSDDAPSTATDSGSPADTATSTDTATGTDTATSTDSATAMDAPADTAPEDITKSKECKDLCDAIAAACPGKMCDPKFDCQVKSPHCVASTRAVLECKATTGSISCGADGYSIIASCPYDDSVCH